MSWFSQCILGGSKQVPPCSPWSPCHGCMNFQNSHRFDWHLPLQKYPRLSESWDPEIGPAKLYWNINSWGDTFEHFAIFPAEKKNSSSTEKNEMTSGNFSPGRPGRSYIKLWRRRGEAQFKGWWSPAAWTCSIGIQESRLRSQIARVRDFHNVNFFLHFSTGIRASKGKWSLNA